MLLRTHQLDQTSLIALESLLTACQKNDNHVIPVYPHLLEKHRSGPSSLLYYDEGMLIGFLAVFNFHPHAYEMVLLVKPTHRQQGIATVLWKTMLPSLQAVRPTITHLVIPTPKGFNPSLFKQHALYFQHSEYDMEYFNNAPCPQLNTPLTIRRAEHTDIANLCAIDNTCFNRNRQHPELRFQNALDNPDVHVFVAEYAAEIIGQVHLTFEKTQVRLTDLAILPPWRRQGFGQTLITYCIHHAYKKNKHRMTLVVEAQNQHALQLYQNIGFEIYNAVDYYNHYLTYFKLDL